MMKRTIFTALALAFSACMVLAQNEKYTQAMTASIQALHVLDKAKPDAKALLDIANQFERIAAAEPKEWLPKYYAGYSNVILGFVGTSLEEKDKYLEKAAALLKDAETIAGKPNDEISVMQAFQSQIHLAADPQNRWEADGAKFAEHLASAKKINAENPRIYYLEASSVFFTPEEFGGGKKPAKPLLEKATQKFAAFKPETNIHPDWGKAETEWMLAQTNQ
ncbi:hypothetical protein L0663_09275 [Dyadobacter sp. CY107]|uniref:hypothetical protein n=1 Tax=Dyadobacter fanqingshengii TaxID=2906443 RepID=UPI001F2B367B|nr:hypothetical protein [Dyadobacter fanqingshengii]MCF2503565.1 hypothetical protein [Dyadobacter fanqingshengii]